VDALDISEEALELARENARLNRAEVRFFQADMLNLPNISQQYSLLVSNPPYVRASEKKFMHRNILAHEPPRALFVDDDDPLLFYRKILNFGRSHLVPKGWIYFEINESLGQSMLQLLLQEGYHHAQVKKDLQAKDRMIKAQKA
jgi:release factor glutamine methyltransferase